MANQVQYMVNPSCNNNCQFCLRDNRGEKWTDADTIERIKNIYKNIEVIDWGGKFADGISLLGGEVFYHTNPEVISEFLKLIDHCIDIIIPQSETARIAFVTNGIYDPNVFLYPVLDKIKERVGCNRLDLAISYDIKYRYASKEREEMALNTIRGIHERYDYRIGVQTILTQYLMDRIMDGSFDIDKFENEICPGSMLCFLYPHPVNRVLDELKDFKFRRADFIEFMLWLKENHPDKYENFYLSTKNSAIKKETGSFSIGSEQEATMQPVLSGSKEILNVRCGHSVLYQCYADSKKCMLCDLQSIGR